MSSIESEVEVEDESALRNLIIRTTIPDDEKFRSVHIVAFILAAVAGRQYSGWQPALAHGFGFFMLMQLIAASACLCWCFCLAEIWSAVPFSGGGYGLSRASMGFFWGFLDGCAEAFLYAAQAALSAMGLGMRFVLLFNLPSHYLLLFCFVFFALSLYLTIQRSLVVLRRAYMFLAALSLLILFAYLLGMLKYVDFAENASLHNDPEHPNARVNWFTGTGVDFMFLLPYSVLPYSGVKSFGLLTIQTKDPKVALPRALLIGFTAIFCINVFSVFVFASQPPGIRVTSALPQPMGYGYWLMFQLKRLDNAKLTTWLSIPAGFAKLLTYILPGGNLLHCLGNSYYLPPVLCLSRTQDRTNGCIVSAALGMALVVIFHFNPHIDLYAVIILITALTNLTFMYSYWKLRSTHSTVERTFVNPFGLAGAAYAVLFFILGGISAGFYQKSWFNLEFVAVFGAVLTLYYFAFARNGERLCEEEDRLFLSMYVRNYNIKKKQNIKKRQPRSVRRVVPSNENSSSVGSNVHVDPFQRESEDQAPPSLDRACKEVAPIEETPLDYAPDSPPEP